MLDDFEDLVVDEVDEDGENGYESESELDAAVQQSDDAVIQELIDSLEGDVEDDSSSASQLRCLTREELDLGRGSLSKILNLSERIFHSPTLWEDLKTCCERSRTYVTECRDAMEYNYGTYRLHS
jgi:hypothetical protein